MSDLTVANVRKSVLSTLESLAEKAGLTVEEYAMQIICDAVAASWQSEKVGITTAQLQDNMPATFRIAEREPVFIADDDGSRFVLLSIAEFERLTNASGEQPITGD